MNSKGALLVGAAMAVGILAACSDSATGPASRSAFVPKASFAVGDPTTVAPPLATELRICKAGNVGGTINVTDVGNGGGGSGNPTIIADQNGAVPGAQVALSPGAGGAANCVMAVIDLGDAFFERGDFFTVTETVGAGVTSVKTCYINDNNTTPDACPANFFINTAHGWTVVFTNTAPPPPGDEGCTPGYWKQDQHFGSWAPVPLNRTFAQAGMSFGFTGSLLAGLDAGGGGVNALARHAAAAYLNAQSGGVDYAYTTVQVQAIANGTGIYAGLSIEARKDLLAAANEAGCPLGRDEG